MTAKASYTVTATGPGGSTTATLTITVNDQSPTQFSYAAGTATYIVNAPITENDPSSAGGAVTSYSVSPRIAGGLELEHNHRRHHRNSHYFDSVGKIHGNRHQHRRHGNSGSVLSP